MQLALVLDGANLAGAALGVGRRQAPVAIAGPLGFEPEAEGLAEKPDEIGGVGWDFDAERLQVEALEGIRHRRQHELALVGQHAVEEEEVAVGAVVGHSLQQQDT